MHILLMKDVLSVGMKIGNNRTIFSLTIRILLINMDGGSKGRMIYDPEIKPLVNMSKEEYRQNKNSTSINHFYKKLLIFKDMMNTETSKRMAEHRQEVMETYLEEFMME